MLNIYIFKYNQVLNCIFIIINVLHATKLTYRENVVIIYMLTVIILLSPLFIYIS